MGDNINLVKSANKIVKVKKIISIFLAVFCTAFIMLTSVGIIFSNLMDRSVLISTGNEEIKLSILQSVTLADDNIDKLKSKISVEPVIDNASFGSLVKVSNQGIMFKYLVDDNTYYLNAFGNKLHTISASTYVTLASYTTINNKPQLEAFRDSVNNGETYLGQEVQLTSDINLYGASWKPIGCLNNGNYTNHKDSKPFMGNFNGNNKTISNFKITSSNGNGFGFFGLVGSDDYGTYDPSIYNLKLSNVTATSSGEYSYGYGILVGVFNGYYLNIQSCFIENSTLSVQNVSSSCNHSYGIGGLLGAYYKKHCGSNYMGGYGGVNITNCLVNATINTSNLNVSYGCIGVGGLLGARFGQSSGADVPNVSSATFTISNSIFHGNFNCDYSYYQFVGGIAGTINTVASGAPLNVYVAISSCYVVADFDVSSYIGPNPIYAGSFNVSSAYLQNFGTSTPYTNATLKKNYFSSNNKDDDFYCQFMRGGYTSQSEIHNYKDTSIYNIRYDDDGYEIPHITRKTW